MKLSQLLSSTVLMISLAMSGTAYAQAPARVVKPHAMSHMQQVLSQLPAEKATLFKDAMKQARDKNKPIMAQIKTLHSDMETIFTAEKFDTNAYLAKTAELDKLQGQIKSNNIQAYVSAVAQLNQSERKIVASAHHKKAKRAKK